MTSGISGEARFRLIVSGPIGSKEIGRLIKKLEMEKEIAEDSGALNLAMGLQTEPGSGASSIS